MLMNTWTTDDDTNEGRRHRWWMKIRRKNKNMVCAGGEGQAAQQQ